MTPKKALAEAVKIAGGKAALGRIFKPPIKGQSVTGWEIAPANRVLDIERATGVSRHDLRPDLWPRYKSRKS